MPEGHNAKREKKNKEEEEEEEAGNETEQDAQMKF